MSPRFNFRFLLIVFLLSITGLAAQDSPFSAGGYLASRYSIGDYSALITGDISLECSFEYEPDFFYGFGLFGLLKAAVVLPQAAVIESYWNTALLFGTSYTIHLNEEWNFVPSLSYGPWLHILNASAVDGRNLDSALYLDQALELGLSFRQKGNSLTVDLSPTYTVLIEPTQWLHLLGFRAGVIYSF